MNGNDNGDGKRQLPGHEWIYLGRDVLRLAILGFLAWAGSILHSVDKLVDLHDAQIKGANAEIHDIRQRLRELERGT